MLILGFAPNLGLKRLPPLPSSGRDRTITRSLVGLHSPLKSHVVFSPNRCAREYRLAAPITLLRGAMFFIFLRSRMTKIPRRSARHKVSQVRHRLSARRYTWWSPRLFGLRWITLLLCGLRRKRWRTWHGSVEMRPAAQRLLTLNLAHPSNCSKQGHRWLCRNAMTNSVLQPS